MGSGGTPGGLPCYGIVAVSDLLDYLVVTVFPAL